MIEEKKMVLEKNEELCKSFLDKLDELRNESSIVFIVGNGISSSDLQATTLINDFFKNLRSLKPRQSEFYENIFRQFLDRFSNIGDDNVNLLQFMQEFDQLNTFKEEFVSYIILRCCQSKPNMKHLYILLLKYLIEQYKGKNFKVFFFTTNYDNNIEKAYVQLNN